MASINKVDNVAKASIARINDVPVANIEAVNNTDWTGLPAPLVMEVDSALLSPSLTMTLGLYSGGSYDFDVDWGDGSAVQTITVWNDPNTTHTFSASQKYTVTLQPNTPTGLTGYDWHILGGTRNAYTSIISFGDVYIDMSKQLFYQCQNINWNTATAGTPNFIRKDSGYRLFRDTDSLTADLTSWGTPSSPVTGSLNQLYYLSKPATSPNLNFYYDSTGASGFPGPPTISLTFSSSNYNAPLDNWDVSAVTEMNECFSNAQLFNQDIGMWNVSSCTNFQNMFSGAVVFNQNLANWNTSSATKTDGMFRNALQFNGALTNWTLPNVTNVQSMFQSCANFNQPVDQLGITSACTNMQFMFYVAGVFNQSMPSWDVSGVTSFYRCFRNCSSFRGGGLSNWVTSSATSFRGMFRFCSNFNEDLSSWDVSSGTNFSYMFQSCLQLNTDLRLWDVRNGTTFQEMFSSCSNLAFDLSGWQIYNATTMQNFVAVNYTNNFTDQQCEDAFVAWSNDVLTATNVNATNIWGNRTYPIGGAMQTATTKLTGATYSWTVTGLTFV